MRVFPLPPQPAPQTAPPSGVAASAASEDFAFLPFCAEAFAKARARHVPVFLLIAESPDWPDDPTLTMQLAERTVPVYLPAGERPDVELLCQRVGALFSGEGALPLCALLLHDARPFLAAPLPPAGFPLDTSRLYVWLAQADRRFAQNLPALAGQAAEALAALRPKPLRKPYAPQDAAHDLIRAMLALEDQKSGGFGCAKSPLVCPLRFLQHAAQRGEQKAHAAVSRALDAMLASALHDPLDGGFFRATLTDDWRVFVPEKPLGVNAMLALILLSGGRRSEAARLLDFIIQAFSLQGGGLSPIVSAPRSTYAFTPEQVCAALGSEDGLRACRLLSLLRQHTQEDPPVTPSRFSPVHEARPRGLTDELPPLYPRLSASLTPEDSAFLRRVLPALLRTRAARMPQQPQARVVTMHCALTAAVLALCGQRLGEARFTQAAQRAVTFLISQPPAAGAVPLPASVSPVGALYAQTDCGASAALALAQLTLGRQRGMEEYAHSGLRLLSMALHTFVRPDGLVLHTPRDPAAFFPRIPALFDGELPSPAALLIHALHIAEEMQPQMRFGEAIEAIWQGAAPYVAMQPVACASLIDAAQQTRGG